MRYKTFRPMVAEIIAFIVAATVLASYQLITGKTLYHAGSLNAIPRFIDIGVMPLCAHVIRRVQIDQAKHDIDTSWTVWIFGIFCVFGAIAGSLPAAIFAITTPFVGRCIKDAEKAERERFRGR